jgi:hypothetical protein
MPRRPPGFNPATGDHVDPAFVTPPHYTVVRAARTYGHLVMVRSTLDRVVKPLRGRTFAARISFYLNRVRHRWWDLATYYADPYLPQNELVYGRFQQLLDCPPPYAFVMPRGHSPCNTTNICPSCHARDAAARWSDLDRGLFGNEPPRGSYLAGITMLVRRACYRFWRPQVSNDGAICNEDDFTLLPLVLDRRISQASRSRFERTDGLPLLPNNGPDTLVRRPTEFKRWQRQGVVCGLETTVVGSPRSDRDPELPPLPLDVPERFWAVMFTSVLFAPTEVATKVKKDWRFEKPGSFPGYAPVDDGLIVEVKSVTDPDRKAVARAVGLASMYPASMILRGDRATLVEYLSARYGRRMTASFGDPARLSTTTAVRRGAADERRRSGSAGGGAVDDRRSQPPGTAGPQPTRAIAAIAFSRSASA